MKSYELQQLYIKKEKAKQQLDKDRRRHKQQHLTNTSSNSTLLKGRSAKICGNFGLWDLKLIIRILSHL